MKTLLEMTQEERKINSLSFTKLYRLLKVNHPLKEFIIEVIEERRRSR